MTAFPPAWCEPWTGIAFERGGRQFPALDCWGIVVHVYAAIGVTVDALDTWGRDDVARAAEGVVAGRFDVVTDPAAVLPLDVLEFDVGEPHAAIAVAPGWLLHTRRRTGSILQRWSRPPLAGMFVRAFRHPEVSPDACPGPPPVLRRPGPLAAAG